MAADGGVLETVTALLKALVAPFHEVPSTARTLYRQVPSGTPFSAQVSPVTVPAQPASGAVAVPFVSYRVSTYPDTGLPLAVVLAVQDTVTVLEPTVALATGVAAWFTVVARA